MIEVSGQSGAHVACVMRDMMGRVITEASVKVVDNGARIVLPVSEVPSGMYTVSTSSGADRSTTTLVVRK